MRSIVSWSGSPPPTAATPRTDRPTYGGALAETARVLGVPFMGWQQLVADRAMEHEGGRLVHREVNVSTDRQAGKSTLFLVAIVHRMLWRRGQWLTYTSASRLAGRRKLLRVWWPVIRSSPLGHMFNVTRGTGTETLECANDSTLILLSGDEASGHGDSIDASFLDEAWSLTEASEQAVRPAMASRPNGQLWVASTAGTLKSTYWRAKVDAGRLASELGQADGPCFVEWAAPPEIDVTDSTTWPTFMPALGRTIQPETVAADLASMSPAEWQRGYCNRWSDESEQGWKADRPGDLGGEPAVSGLYGGPHQAIRKALAPYVPGSRCWRCGLPILPGQPWDLGHDDDNPARYRGPEHSTCNRRAGQRKATERRRARRERTVRMVTEVALALEIAEDRRHTSIVAAGHLEDDLVLLDLVAYLASTDPVPAVLALRKQRKVLAVAVDSHSHAATCIAPLEAAGVMVSKPTSADLVVAHGDFLDALAGGRIRHQGQAELTAAMRFLEQRALGGAAGPERRGAPGDVAPAVAAELSLWALQHAVPRQPFFLATWR